MTHTRTDLVSAKPAAPASPQSARWLALGAIAGPVLFTLAWFVLGFLSPGYRLFGTLISPYSPISQPISGLGLGPTAPFMNAEEVRDPTVEWDADGVGERIATHNPTDVCRRGAELCLLSTGGGCGSPRTAQPESRVRPSVTFFRRVPSLW